MSDAGGEGGRYARTTNGLIASLIVTVIAVGGFVIFRSAFSDDLVVKQEPVDYLAVMSAAHDAGLDYAFPASLPAGWTATSIDYTPDQPVWGVGVLTDSGTFVGLHQEDKDVDELLDTYVDRGPDEADGLTVPGSVATDWKGWSDSGGDNAFSTEYAGDTLLVYGSASRADQETFISLLVSSTQYQG